MIVPCQYGIAVRLERTLLFDRNPRAVPVFIPTSGDPEADESGSPGFQSQNRRTTGILKPLWADASILPLLPLWNPPV